MISLFQLTKVMQHDAEFGVTYDPALFEEFGFADKENAVIVYKPWDEKEQRHIKDFRYKNHEQKMMLIL